MFGDWGLGIGDWGLGIGPNPQSPIPNPHNYDNEFYKAKSILPKNLVFNIYIMFNQLIYYIYF